MTLAVAMLVGTAIAGTLTAPYAAYAENVTNDTVDTSEARAGALCTPTTQSMGTNISDASKQRDPSAATWVGGDMFIGKRPANSTVDDPSRNNLMNANGPDGSYAVEVEGLTVVNGKLLLNPQKNSWANTNEGGITGGGFRFGIVGFGTQFRPADGSTALVVGGNGDTVIDSGISATAKVKAWTRSGFIKDFNHKGSLAGSRSGVWNQNNYASIRQEGNASVSWDATANNTDNLKHVKVKTENNGNDTDKDFSEETFYQDYVVEDVSAPLANQSPTGTTTITEADTASVTRHKYNSKANGINYVFKYDDNTKQGTGRGIANGEKYKNREKLITFTGTNNPSMEVFTINASDLTDYIGATRYRGIAFAFDQIADTASVVVNVTGDQKDVAFHTGWKFYWNGSEISDGYSDVATDTAKSAYAKAAQKILWNFHDTDNLTIYGGVANEDGNNTNADKITQDDPAAAMIGSIIVIGNASSGDNGANPSHKTGNFESHVSTNGRVYTEGDFSMYNPYMAYNFTATGLEGKSASVIDMDQERHNFPWNGSATTQCAAIEWQKSDAAGKQLLAGTSWAIYGTYEDAVANDKSKALYTEVKDDDFADKAHGAGLFRIEGLKENANYFIREVAASEDYQVNTNIYYVSTGKASDPAGQVVHSVTRDATSGKLVLGNAMITSVTVKSEDENGAETSKTYTTIGNEQSGHAVSWKKVDADDSAKSPLAGSSWQIKSKDDTTGKNVWNVTDNVNAATAVTITQPSSPIELNATNSWQSTLTASVQPANAMQDVTWVFTDADGTVKDNEKAASLQRQNATTTYLYGSNTGTTDATVYVKACSSSNPTVCSDPLPVTVKPMSVSSFTVQDADKNEVKAGTTFTTKQDAELSFTAAVQPANVPITWESSDESVATVSYKNNGTSATVTMHALGSSTITVRAGNQVVSFTVTIPFTTVYFHHTENGWTGNIELYYQADGQWTTSVASRPKLTQSACNSDYVYVRIPKPADGAQFGFKKVGEESTWYGKSVGGNFTFNGGDVVTVSYGGQSYSYPDSCSAASAASVSDADEVASADEAVSHGDASAQVADIAAGDAFSEDAVVAPVADETRATSCTATDGDSTNAGVKCDIDTVAGRFKVDGLAAGTYLIHELTAPNGYTLNKTVYQFTIADNGTVTWDGGWTDGNVTGDPTPGVTPDQANGNAISDKPTKVTWEKVDSKHGQALAGSQWAITSGNTKYCVADNEKADSANANFTCDGGMKLSDTNAAAGTITVTKLPKGTYTLKETKAPDGYKESDTTYTFTIDENSTDVKIGTDGKIKNELKPVDVTIPVKKSVTGGSWPTANGSYVPFKFAITAFNESDVNSLPRPEGCTSLTGTSCTIEIAPSSDANDKLNVEKSFGKIKFTADNLDANNESGNYAKTYTYKITEVKPTDADSSIQYSQAEYKVVVTVSQANSAGKWGALKVSYTMYQMTDDSNTKLNGDTGKQIGTWALSGAESNGTSGRPNTGNTGSSKPTATFTNQLYGPELPATGGEGTAMFLRAGTFALIVATAGLALMVRRQRR